MTPVIIQDTVSVAAGATVENLIAGNTGANRYIRAPFDAIGRLFASVTGTLLRLELVADGVVIMDSSDTRISAVAGNLLQPDDLVVEQFFIRLNGQLVLRAVNLSAGALSVNYRIELQEAEEIPPRMRVTQRTQSIAATSIVQLLTGLRFERPLADSLLAIFATASAAGLTMEVFVDGQSVAPALPIGALNRVPINPYDMLLNGIEVPNDKLIEMRVNNPTGGALTVNWREVLQELELKT